MKGHLFSKAKVIALYTRHIDQVVSTKKNNSRVLKSKWIQILQYSEVYSDDITIITNCKWLKLLKQSIEHILPAVNNDVDQNIEFDTINIWIHSLPPMIHQTFFII